MTEYQRKPRHRGERIGLHERTVGEGGGITYLDGRLMRIYVVDWVDPHHGLRRCHFARLEKAVAFGRNVRSDGEVLCTRYEVVARKSYLIQMLDAAARVGVPGDVGATEYPGLILRIDLWREDGKGDE